MLNSRFAPVVALTVLAVVLVGVIGWFAGIKPIASDAAALRAEADKINANAEVINLASARIDQYEELLRESATTDDLLAVHAPTTIDVATFRARVAAAVVAASAEVVGVAQAQGELVEGWEATPAVLVSNQVAADFAQGPVAIASEAELGTWTPVVAPTSEAGPVARDLRMVAFELRLAGTTGEIDAFLTAMADPEQPLFQIFSVQEVARPASSGVIPGVSDAVDGDVLVSIRGALYSHNSDLTVLDDDPANTATPVPDAFINVTEVPAQAGASK